MGFGLLKEDTNLCEMCSWAQKEYIGSTQLFGGSYGASYQSFFNKLSTLSPSTNTYQKQQQWKMPSSGSYAVVVLFFFPFPLFLLSVLCSAS